MRGFATLRYQLILFFLIASAIEIPCSASDKAVFAKDLTYITEQLPPYNYQENGKLKGIFVDLLEKIWERMGANLNRSAILVLPWTEGYERALKENNTALFSTARTPEREKLFKWAGPIESGRIVLLSKANKSINILAPEDLKKYRIGGVRNDIGVQMLLDKGMKKEDLVLDTNSTPIIDMLENGTIDAWAYNDIAGFWLLQQSCANASNYKAAYVLGSANVYIAFNNRTFGSLVQSFQQAIDYIKSNKDQKGVTEYEKVLYKYIPQGSIRASSNMTDLVSFVESAVAFAKKNGKDKALKEFCNKTGSFVRGELYIYAYDFNGTNIAHPFKTDWIGKNKINESDSNGVMYIRNLIDVAKEGKGFTYFIFPNPAHDNQNELKIGYVMKVDDSWWLGSGLYLSDISASFDQKEREDLAAYVNEALGFAKRVGKQRSIAVFNDQKGNFTRDGRYIFAYDYDGRNLALPFQPAIIGTNRLNVQDPNGVYFIKQLINTAKSGNGFFYYIYPDPSRNMMPALKLSYVVSVDGVWILGSGDYVKGQEQSE